MEELNKQTEVTGSTSTEMFSNSKSEPSTRGTSKEATPEFQADANNDNSSANRKTESKATKASVENNLVKLGLDSQVLKKCLKLMNDSSSNMLAPFKDSVDTVKYFKEGDISDKNKTMDWLSLITKHFFALEVKERETWAEFLAYIDFNKYSLPVYKSILKLYGFTSLNDAVIDGEVDVSGVDLQSLYHLRTSWWNFTDSSPEKFGGTAAVSNGILEECVQDMKNLVGSDGKKLV